MGVFVVSWASKFPFWLFCLLLHEFFFSVSRKRYKVHQWEEWGFFSTPIFNLPIWVKIISKALSLPRRIPSCIWSPYFPCSQMQLGRFCVWKWEFHQFIPHMTSKMFHVHFYDRDYLWLILTTYIYCVHKNMDCKSLFPKVARVSMHLQSSLTEKTK